MNILLMVTIMLLMLTLMTTAKLETYRSTQILDKFFNHYMEVEERGFISKHAENEYKTTKMTSSGPKEKSGKKVDAIPRLSLYKLENKKMQKEKPLEWKQLVNLLHKLTDVLYGQHPFYKNFLEKRPSAIEDLAVQLTKGINSLDTEKKPKSGSDLANIPLKDPELDAFFYKMLLGAPYKDIFVEHPLPEPKAIGAEEDNEEDEDTLGHEAKEYSSPIGYYSLLDFITMQKKDKIRLYLAPKELLLAIFNDPNVVNEIIAKRQELYKQAVADKEGKETNKLSLIFRSEFEQIADPTIDKNFLDFTVNKTNPKEYERSPVTK